jgi:hypothetical protein
VPETGLLNYQERPDGFRVAHYRAGENKFYQIEFLQSKHPEIFGEI